MINVSVASMMGRRGRNSTPPPRLDLAVLRLNMRAKKVGSDYYVTDLISGKDFLITGKDFDITYGFPFKTGASISAPAADATLIAEDVNNFLYDSGGTPNAIPPCSMFNNIDYENKLFFRYASAVEDEDGVYLKEPFIAEMVLYSEALTGADLTDANTFFGVETVSNDYWVAATGDDTTGTGTFVNPWKTWVKAYNTAPAGSNIYVKTNETTEALYTVLKNIAYSGTGLSKYNAAATAYGMRLRGSVYRHLKRINFNANAATTAAIYFQDATNAAVDNCRIIGVCAYLAYPTFKIIKNSYFYQNRPGLSGYILSQQINVPWVVDNNYLYSNSYGHILTNAASGIGIIKNNYFTGGASIPLRILTPNKQSIIGNKFINAATQRIIEEVGDLCELQFVKNHIEQGVTSQEMIYISGLTTNFANFEQNKIISTNSEQLIYILTSNCLLKNNAIIHTEETAQYSDFYFGGILNTYAEVENNYINSKRIGGYNIGIGGETTSAYDNTAIRLYVRNNHIYGNGGGTHNIFVGFQINADVKYNRIDFGGYGAVIKGSTSTVYTENGFQYNLIVDSQRGVYSKGVSGLSIVNNTIINKTVDPVYAIQLGENTGGDNAENCVVKNNIIINTSGETLTAIQLDANNSTHDIDYNIYCSNGGLYFVIGGTSYTFAQWQALGYDTNSVVLTEAQAKALFIDYDNGDFRLANGSQAIGFGDDLGVDYNTGLDGETKWGSDDSSPVILTKTNTNWDAGCYVS